MKRFLCIVICVCLSICASYAQNDTNDTTSPNSYSLSPKDSLILEGIGYTADLIHPRYKMYQTENLYNLIKLDTMTGAIWQVQYGMNKDVDAM